MTDVISNPPSIDPAQRDSLFGTIQFVIDKMVMQEIEKMMPCRVIAVGGNRVSVQIAISMVSTAGEQVIRAPIASVPIYSPSAGGFVIHLPVKAGDLGWIKSTDTDMSLFLQNLVQTPANTELLHKFDSSVFFPDNMNKGVTIADGDAANLVIQNYAGTCKISMSETAIAFTSTTLTHNGVNIGATHVHGGVTSGSSDTGVPI